MTKAMRLGIVVALGVAATERCIREFQIAQDGLPRFDLEFNDLSNSAHGLCHYHLKTENGGHGALSIDSDGSKSGYYTFAGQTYTLESRRKQRLVAALFRYNKRGCKQYFTPPDHHLEFVPSSSTNWTKTRAKRDVEQKYIELMMVVTKGLVDKHRDADGGDLTAQLRPVFARYERVHNLIDSFYKLVGIRVALLDIVLWRDEDEIELGNKNSGEILDHFRTWRRNQPKNGDLTPNQRARWKAHDNAQLIVPVDTFENPTIGKGWTDAFCESYSAGVNEDHQDNALGLATTMTHEMGHNVGLNHDTAGCTCEEGAACIMEPSSTPSNPASAWSSCSKDRLADRREHWPCLDDMPDKNQLYGEKNCGNGIVERGEDCDCGDAPTDECLQCCDATKCEFKAGADCSDQTGPCCKNCRLQSAGTVCRAQKSDCDLPEYCNGYSSSCPPNVFVRNGEHCPEGRCMSGSCLSQNGHCQYLFGNTAKANTTCMSEFNSGYSPSSSGNCGESYRISTYFSRCRSEQDALCGKVNCDGGEDVSVQSEFSDVTVRYNRAEDGQCKYLDWSNSHTELSGNQFYNMDRMPMGTPCGTENVCFPAAGSSFRAECRHLSELWVENEWGTCTGNNNCSGNGVCNSEGNCHCHNKWGGEACDQKGYGGSMDSGPANAKVRDEGTVMFASIFAVIFALLVVSALVAKFHFGRNLTDICYYQPCAGNKSARNRAHSSPEFEPQPPVLATADPFNNDGWDDSAPSSVGANVKEQIYVDAIDKSFLARNQHPPARPTAAPRSAPKTRQNTSDPFRADWDDSEISAPSKSQPSVLSSTSQRPIRTAPPPPKPPALPPKDY